MVRTTKADRTVAIRDRIKKLPKGKRSLEEQVTVGDSEVSSIHGKFRAGRLKYFLGEWKNITSDQNILEIVQNCKIEFKNDTQPFQEKFFEPNFNAAESAVIDMEIKDLLENGAIVEANHEPDKFISSIFVRPKENGEYRVILNLKNLNEFIPYHHFKMDTSKSAVNLLAKGCYMASIDVRHAYHTIPIAEEHQKFLRFIWKGKIFQYTCLPFGLSSEPRIFTKILKPVFAKLRMIGFVNISYIDDILLMVNSEDDGNLHVEQTRLSLEK